MNKTEKYIHNLINKIQIPCQNIQCPIIAPSSSFLHDNKATVMKQKSKRSFRYITVLGCLLLLTFSLPVMARLPFVTERMQSLSHKEITELADMTNQQSIGADLFSRPLTDQERVRLLSIREAYINGDFPQNDISIISSNEIAGDAFCYSSETGMFFLPSDRELTDEELKQYVDFYYKRDFSLQSQQTHKGLKSENTQSDAVIDAIVESDIALPEQHRKLIANWIKVFGFYEFNLANLTLQEIVPSDTSENNYIYTYQDSVNILSFTITEDMLALASMDEAGETLSKTESDNRSINKLEPLKYTDNYQHIKNILQDTKVTDFTITSAWYLCATDANDNLSEPYYSYMLEVNDDQKCWLVSYKYGSTYPYRIWLTTTSWYYENLERGKNINALKGITREVIPLDLETGQILPNGE